MIQIERPDIYLYICNCSSCFSDPVYYKIDNGFFIKTKNINYYINNNGYKHREDGYAYINKNNIENSDYCINGYYYSCNFFAIKTKHILCSFCNNFCKQKCFI